MDREHLVAHRGWQRRYPENTLPAVQGALAAGARYVEVDVQLSADGEPVLFHDRTLRRICRQSGAIHQYRYAELQQFSADEPDRFDTQFLGTPIPHLNDLVALLQRHADAHLFLEIKRIAVLQFGSAAVYDAVIPLIQSIATRCTLISFSFEFLQYAAQRGYARVGPVLNTWEEIDSPTLRALQPAVVFCDVDQLPAQRDLHALDFPLAVYEVDEITRASALLARGVRWVETFAVGELLEQTA
jgi:glycerophosphoryl diester phosphodiesterase